MTLEWDIEKIVFSGNENNPFLSNSPRKWTIRTESFCPICNTPKTFIMGFKIKKYLNKHLPRFRFLLQHIKDNNLQNFTIKDLIKSLNAQNLTDGNLQRKMLSVLVGLGYFKRINQEFENKKGKKTLRYLFVRQEPRIIPECYDEITDKHKNVEWVRKTLFDSKAKKEVGDNDTNTN
jgi:hypothetical protein